MENKRETKQPKTEKSGSYSSFIRQSSTDINHHTPSRRTLRVYCCKYRTVGSVGYERVDRVVIYTGRLFLAQHVVA